MQIRSKSVKIVIARHDDVAVIAPLHNELVQSVFDCRTTAAACAVDLILSMMHRTSRYVPIAIQCTSRLPDPEPPDIHT